MIIALWLILRILFVITSIFLLGYIITHLKSSDALHTLTEGFKESLRDCGLIFKRNKHYTVELYQWKTKNDDKVCEDCLERASWPPMDIADWMKEGLPRTPEAHTECGENCRCRLVLVKSKKLEKQYNNQNFKY